MAIIVPNRSLILESSACVPGSEGVWVWIGIQTDDSPGAATWYASASPIAGQEMMVLSRAPLCSDIFGPYCSASGLYARVGAGACAVLWFTERKEHNNGNG